MGSKLTGRERRKLRIRRRVTGTTERPRLSVYRSGRHIYAQVVLDSEGRTLAAASTLSRDLKGTLEEDDKSDAARKVGALMAGMRSVAEMASGRSCPAAICPANSP